MPLLYYYTILYTLIMILLSKRQGDDFSVCMSVVYHNNIITIFISSLLSNILVII